METPPDVNCSGLSKVRPAARGSLCNRTVLEKLLYRYCTTQIENIIKYNYTFYAAIVDVDAYFL